jgi:hypothetical protein
MTECGYAVEPAPVALPDAVRQGLIQQAFCLEWFNVAWMAIEALVAGAAGVAAHSISLTHLALTA